MITVQALVNNRPSLRARQEPAFLNDTKPIAIDIINSHPSKKSSATSSAAFLDMTLYYRNGQRERGRLVVTDYISDQGLLIISTGISAPSDEYVRDVLSLDDASIHCFLSTLIDQMINFKDFNTRQPLILSIGRHIVQDGRYDVAHPHYYGGSLHDVQHLGNSEHQVLYYDGTNRVQFGSCIEMIDHD